MSKSGRPHGGRFARIVCAASLQRILGNSAAQPAARFQRMPETERNHFAFFDIHFNQKWYLFTLFQSKFVFFTKFMRPCVVGARRLAFYTGSWRWRWARCRQRLSTRGFRFRGLCLAGRQPTGQTSTLGLPNAPIGKRGTSTQVSREVFRTLRKVCRQCVVGFGACAPAPSF